MLARHVNVTIVYTLFCFGHERRLALTQHRRRPRRRGGHGAAWCRASACTARPPDCCWRRSLVSLPANVRALAREQRTPRRGRSRADSPVVHRALPPARSDRALTAVGVRGPCRRPGAGGRHRGALRRSDDAGPANGAARADACRAPASVAGPAAAGGAAAGRRYAGVARRMSTTACGRPRVVHVAPALFGPGASSAAPSAMRSSWRGTWPTPFPTLVGFGDADREEWRGPLRVRTLPAWHVRGQRSNPFSLAGLARAGEGRRRALPSAPRAREQHRRGLVPPAGRRVFVERSRRRRLGRVGLRADRRLVPRASAPERIQPAGFGHAANDRARASWAAVSTRRVRADRRCRATAVRCSSAVCCRTRVSAI